MSVKQLFGLEGRVAVVTGASGRYGRIISYALAEAGAHVVLAARNEEKCQAFSAELAEAGLSADFLQLDLANEASIKGAWNSLLAKHGRADILFNNAVRRAGDSFDAMTPEDWSATLCVNATGLFLICRIAAQDIGKSQSLSIVNVASFHGVVSPDFSLYGSTGMSSPANYAFEKGGMIQLTRYLAVWLASKGIRVNCLSPGPMDNAALPDEFRRGFLARTPLRRMVTPDDLKGAAVFLASDASAFITGQNLILDGGYTAL